MKNRKFFWLVPVCILCVSLLLGLIACGKRGLPVPQDQNQTFALKNVQLALSEQGILTLVATLTGTVKNVDVFTLELEPSTDDVCVGCPFAPRESVVLQPDTRVVTDTGMSYTFSYQVASEAPKFRWRFGVQNVHPGFPHALTPLDTVYRAGGASHVLPIN